MTPRSEQTSTHSNTMYYLKKAAATAVPTHEQNLELFQLMETAGSRLNKLKADPGAHAAEIKRWERQAMDARDRLILGNQGLVGSIAKKYGGLGLAYEDLVGAGTFGLIRAVDKFDHRKGFKLSTYATRLIQGAISRALSKYSRTIRIPECQLPAIRELQKTTERLREEYHREPSAAEIAGEAGLPVDKIAALLALGGPTVSLDAPYGDADGASIIGFIPDESASDPAEEADRANQAKMINEAMETLTARESEVIELYYGRDGKHTLEKIGKRFGLSRERIRQIKDQAEKKLREFGKASEPKAYAKPVQAKPAAVPKTLPDPSPTQASPGVPAPRACRLKMRAVENNPNHHIWKNNGTWYCHFTLVTAAGKENRVRNSLHTHDVVEARRRRDKLILLHLAARLSSAA